MRRIIKSTPSFKVVAILTVLLFLCTNVTLALPYGSGTYGTCVYDPCGITMTTGGTVNLSTSPTTSGIYTIQNDAINVKTGASTGYTVQLSSNSANTNLVNGANNVAASLGTFSSPSTLSTNAWGYRLDSIGSFGSGPTSSVTNASSSSLTFAGITSSASPQTIISTSSASAGAGDNYNVWYGIRLNMTLPAGNYSQTVLYTATQKI